MFEERIYDLALALTKGIGPIYASKIIENLGSSRVFFESNKKELREKLNGLPSHLLDLDRNAAIQLAESELKWANKHNIQTITFNDRGYPNRLKHIPDKPLSLFVKGSGNLDSMRTIGIVGTRKATEYGKGWLREFIKDLVPYGVQIISGLAYGIDICAHKLALNYDLSTIGVLGHGLSGIYPASHRNIANEMLNNGAIISEFKHDEKPDRQHFPMRNRIIAGLSDVLIVVESGLSGGSMITADLAFNYNKDIFALAGPYDADWSRGCHKLIKEQKARLITSVNDIQETMNWQKIGDKVEIQSQLSLFNQLSDQEKNVFNLIKKEKDIHIDKLIHELHMPLSTLNLTLLELQLKGLIKSLPGSRFIPL